MIVVLIPAYKPADTFLPLLRRLRETGFSIIVAVDDGSGPEYSAAFQDAEAMGVLVLRHAVNLGKGRALKTGFNEILNRYPDATVVTADCDGQHTPEDIAKVASLAEKNPGAMTLGERSFTGNVPFKSRFGNAVMRAGFFLSTGAHVQDTQTGLRVFGPQILPQQISIPGERYEYEMNALLYCPAHAIPILHVPIETIYINQNQGSHFHPLRDAMRVFGRLLSFAASSIASAAVDYAGYAALLEWAALPAQQAYFGARVVSCVVNFLLNRSVVFHTQGKIFWQAVKYALLALGVALGGTYLVKLLTTAGMNNYLAKVLTDILFFVVSFIGQRAFVFRTPKAPDTPA